MPVFKASGNPISLLREHLLVNSSSFGTNVADFFPYLSRIDGTPARLTHVRDSTTYVSNPVEDSWEQRLAGGAGSVAHVAAINSSANIRGGQLT